MDRVSVGRIVLVIVYRFSIVRGVYRIVVMVYGRVCEVSRGSGSRLMGWFSFSYGYSGRSGLVELCEGLVWFWGFGVIFWTERFMLI